MTDSTNNAISIREYARRKGCSDMNVRQAIKAGKIVQGVVTNEAGKPKIVPEIADREWAANFAPEKIQNAKLAASLGVPLPDSTASVTGDDSDPDSTALPDATDNMTMAQAQRVEWVYKAKLRKIEYEKAAGSLVEMETVYRNLFAYGKEVGAAIMAIPDREIDLILAAPNRNAAHKHLYDALANALEKLAEIETRDFTK
jgi:hypothetical protein